MKTLAEIREIALRKTKEILNEIDIKETDFIHPQLQYEMQFEIYHSIKKALQL